MALFANLEVDMGDKGKITYLEGVMKHPGQKLIHFQNWMYLVLDWGRRTGKTIGAAAEAVWELSMDNRKIWIVAPTYELTDRVFEIVYKWVVLDNCFGGKSVVRSAKSKDARYIQMKWGAIIRGKSADAPASLLGDQTDLIIMDEAARIPEGIWVEALEPTTIDRTGRVIFVSTPRGKNWFYYYWLRGTEAATIAKGWMCSKFATWDNPFTNKEWLETKRSETPEIYWNREYGASFEDFGGAVYPEYSDRPRDLGGHLYKDGEVDLTNFTCYGGLDIGWKHPTAHIWVYVDPKTSDLYVDNEYEETGLFHADHAKNIAALTVRPLYMTLGSPDAARKPGLNSGEKCVADIYRENGIFIRPAMKDAEPAVAIASEYIRATKEASPHHPKVYINERCVKLRKALLELRFVESNTKRDTKSPEKIEKKNDDLPDAFRHVVAFRPRPVRAALVRGPQTYHEPVVREKPRAGRPFVIGVGNGTRIHSA